MGAKTPLYKMGGGWKIIMLIASQRIPPLLLLLRATWTTCSLPPLCLAPPARQGASPFSHQTYYQATRRPAGDLRRKPVTLRNLWFIVQLFGSRCFLPGKGWSPVNLGNKPQYEVCQKKVHSELLDLALIMGACLNPLCICAIVSNPTEGIQTGIHNQC